MIKKLTILLGIFLILVSGYAFAEEPITVLINGEPLASDVPAQELPVYDENGDYVGDRVMVPLRAIGESLNCDVHWNPTTEGITLYRLAQDPMIQRDQVIMMWIGKESGFLMDYYALSKCYTMDVPPTLIEDRTMVPVRATTELFGADVTWMEETNTVSITYEMGEPEDYTGAAEFFQIYSMNVLEKYETYTDYFNGNLDTVTGSIILTDDREIPFELYPQFAPITCERFIACAKDGFYDGTLFHRVIEGFVAQGGGVDGEFELKDTEKYPNITGEFLANGQFNLLPHDRGYLSFARTNELDGGSTQFFIVHQASDFLNGEYAAFGKVTEGMDVVDAICSVETDEYDFPVEPIMVKTIVIDEK